MPSELKVNKLSPYTGSTLTLGDSGDTISLPSGVSLDTLTITGDLTVDTDTLYVDSTNNRVGVGTTSPANKLHVQNAGGGSGGYLKVTDAVHGGDVRFGMADGVNNDAVAGTFTNNNFVFFTNNTERMRITDSGDLLVGKTSSDIDTAGIELKSDRIYSTRDGSIPLFLNRLTSDGDIVEFRKDGTEVGSIGAISGDAYIVTGDVGLRFDDGNNILRPVSSSGADQDATINIGGPSQRFSSAYLSGSVYLGGTTSANALDDYEEGTWTPSFNFGGGTTGLTYNQQFGNYTKIGRLVHVKIRILLTSKGTSTGHANITGFPFNPSDDFTGVTFEKGGGLDNWNNMNTASNYRYVLNQSGTLSFYKIDTNTTGSFSDDAVNTDFTDSSDIRLTITYTTD